MLGIVRDKILSTHPVDMSLSLHPKDPCSAADVLMNPMPVTAFVPDLTDTRSWRLHSQIRSQRQEEQAHQARLSQSIADMPTLMPQRCSYQSLSMGKPQRDRSCLRSDGRQGHQQRKTNRQTAVEGSKAAKLPHSPGSIHEASFLVACRTHHLCL